MCHSRYLAKRYGMRPSALCMADKLAIALTPWWLYIPMTVLTGEIYEYRAADRRKAGWSHRRWYKRLQEWATEYVELHKDGREDMETQSRAEGSL